MRLLSILLLSTIAVASAVPHAAPSSLLRSLRDDLRGLGDESDDTVESERIALSSLGRDGEAGFIGDVLAEMPGDRDRACHTCHWRDRRAGRGCSGREVIGICGRPGECAGRKVSGHCNGGSDNVCCVGTGRIRADIEEEQQNTPDDNGNGNGNSGGDLSGPASPAELTAPYPKVNGGPEGTPGAKCMQGYRGVCNAPGACDTANGYRTQRGLCKGSEICCLPKNAGGNDDIIPNAFFTENLCFPLTRASFAHTGSDFGNGRPRSRNLAKRNKRCHAGQDIFSKSPGLVKAVADGFVTHVSYSFLNCRSGWGIRQHFGGRAPQPAGAVYVYHPSLGVTINYGEADGGKATKVKKGDPVSRGQTIARASVCGMLHFEVYKGKKSGNLRWWGSTECANAAAKGKAYQCKTPDRAAENNYCAKYAPHTRHSDILDPRPYLELLAGKWCD